MRGICGFSGNSIKLILGNIGGKKWAQIICQDEKRIIS